MPEAGAIAHGQSRRKHLLVGHIPAETRISLQYKLSFPRTGSIMKQRVEQVSRNHKNNSCFDGSTKGAAIGYKLVRSELLFQSDDSNKFKTVLVCNIILFHCH